MYFYGPKQPTLGDSPKSISNKNISKRGKEFRWQSRNNNIFINRVAVDEKQSLLNQDLQNLLDFSKQCVDIF